MVSIVKVILLLEKVLLFWVKPEKGRIQFLTNEATKPEGNFKQIIDALKEKDIDPYFYGVKFSGSITSKLHYLWVCIKQYYLCRKAEKVILNDNNFVISTLKPPQLEVIQIWHACGAVKKFGSQLTTRKYQISGYDKVLCSGDYWKSVFADAFSVEKEQVITTGLPCTDVLSNYKGEPVNMISYLPTFRGTSMGKLDWVTLDEDKLLKSLPENWQIQTKHHPLAPKQSSTGNKSLNDILMESKIIITDYSSILFDASLLDNRTILIYAPDYDKYKDTVGYNMPLLEDFAGYVATSYDNLVELLNNVILEPKPNSHLIRKKYMKYNDGKNLERVIQVILDND